MRIESGVRGKRRRRGRRNRLILAACAGIALVAVAVLLLSTGRGGDAVVPAQADAAPREQALSQNAEATAPAESAPPQAVETAAPAKAPDPGGAPIPLYDDPEIRARWSGDQVTKFSRKDVKLLPILNRSKNTRMIAITIDDCFQFENIREMLDLADQYGAKLTFFPIGYQIKKQPDIWQQILDRGHEIENHSFHHLNISPLTDEQLYRTITMAEQELNKALGYNYKMKYFRPHGGEGIKSLRLSKALRELGYQAVASWGLSGGQDVNKVLRLCKGGEVLLFHTTDKDLKKLKKFIPAISKRGIQMVTLNELYGKPANVIAPLPPEAAPPAPPAPDAADALPAA